MNLNAVTTVTSGAPTAASGIVTFEVADPASIPVVPCLALHYPQLRNDSSGVTRAKQSQAIVITALVGNLATASVGYLGTTGRSINFSDIIDCAYFATFNQGQATMDLRSSPSQEVTTGLGSTSGTRINIFDGSDASPVTNSPVVHPSAYISRTVYVPGTADWGALAINVKALAGGVGQSNAIEAYIDNHASADANVYSAQVVMNGSVRGSGYGYFSIVSQTPVTVAITHASPAVFTAPNHGMPANREFQLNSTVNISSVSAAVSAKITTAVAHGLSSGNLVVIEDTDGNTITPTVNGTHIATVIDATSFTIPVHTTVGASAGGIVTSKTLPSPLLANTRYFVKTVIDANTFTAQDIVGTTINTTTNGSGTFYITGVSLFGYNPVQVNGSKIHHDYEFGGGSGQVTMEAISIQSLGGGYRTGMGIHIFGGDPLLSQGFVADANSIYREFLRDESGAITSYKIGGSHVNGVDASAGTFSDFAFKVYTGFGLVRAGVQNELSFEGGYGLIHDTSGHVTSMYENAAVTMQWLSGAIVRNVVENILAISPASAPGAGYANFYADAGGAGGKLRLMARFPSGAAQVVASEP